MKEYNRVTNEIHAPKDLIERTKAAVKKEELRIEEEKKKTVVFRKGLVAAAAVLAVAVITVPAVRLGIGTQTGEESEWQDEIGGNVMLGQEKDEPGKLERDKTVIEAVTAPVIHTGEPEKSVEIEGVSVEVYLEENSDATADFTVGEIFYHAINKKGNIEKLLEDVEAYLRELP